MEKLIVIQNELKVPKGNFNSFGKYKYRSAEDILEAVKPILLKHNTVLTLSDEIIAIGNKIFLKATAHLIFGADATLPITTYGYAETGEHKGMSAEQTTGTASSYARKYALNGLFLIDETESDADSRETKKELPKQPFKKTLYKFLPNSDDLTPEWLNATTALKAKKTTIEGVREVYIIPVNLMTELEKLWTNTI